jgi:hypothetical protein
VAELRHDCLSPCARDLAQQTWLATTMSTEALVVHCNQPICQRCCPSRPGPVDAGQQEAFSCASSSCAFRLPTGLRHAFRCRPRLNTGGLPTALLGPIGRAEPPTMLQDSGHPAHHRHRHHRGGRGQHPGRFRRGHAAAFEPKLG